MLDEVVIAAGLETHPRDGATHGGILRGRIAALRKAAFLGPRLTPGGGRGCSSRR